MRRRFRAIQMLDIQDGERRQRYSDLTDKLRAVQSGHARIGYQEVDGPKVNGEFQCGEPVVRLEDAIILFSKRVDDQVQQFAFPVSADDMRAGVEA